MRKSSIILIVTLTLSVFGMAGCDKLEFISPPGETGLNAYQVWVDAVKRGVIVWNEGTDLPNYLKYIKGEEGKSAYAIWSDWVKEGNVDDPHNSNRKWSADKTSKKDFYRYLTGAKGDDGLTPFVNQKGNWQIGDKDTGIPARGIDGDKGDKGNTGPKGPKGDEGDKGNTGPKGPKGDEGDKGNTGPKGPKGDEGDKGNTGPKGPKGDNGKEADKVSIKEGFWYINDKNTGVKVKGEQGDQGDRGKRGVSAYELWLKEVKDGTIKDKNGLTWSNTKTTLQDFWEFLKGKDGTNGSGNGGNNNTEVEETSLKVVSIEEYTEAPNPGDQGKPKPSIPKLKIVIQTEPGATLYYQYSTDDKFYRMKPGNGGVEEEYTQSQVNKISIDKNGNGQHEFIVTIKEKDVLHVWAKIEGKAKSRQHHLSLGRDNPWPQPIGPLSF